MPEATYVPPEQQSAEDLRYMREALAMAQEAFDAAEIPVGSVFVRQGKIIAKARNRTNELMNATRHAELEAIDYILSIFPPSSSSFATAPHSQAPGENPFADTTLYVTVEPCIMCGSALRQVGIGRVVFGAGNERFGGNGSVLAVHSDPALVNAPPYEAVGGYYRAEAIMLLRRFYLSENANAPNPKSKAHRTLKTEIQPPGVSMHGPAGPSRKLPRALRGATTSSPAASSASSRAQTPVNDGSVGAGAVKDAAEVRKNGQKNDEDSEEAAPTPAGETAQPDSSKDAAEPEARPA